MTKYNGSTKHFLLLLGAITLLVIGCAPQRGSSTRTYTLDGTVNMVNDCTGNIADLPDKVKVIVELHFTDTTVTPSRFDEDFAAKKSGAASKDAKYSFSSGVTNLEATHWEVTDILRSNAVSICADIMPCPDASQVCRNRATRVDRIPIPSGDTAVTQDFSINCSCGAS